MPEQWRLYLEALLLGAVEGLTEFIPVSSTAHLILVGDLIGFKGPPGKVFEIVIQLGAILAICWLYRARIFSMAFGMFHVPKERKLALNIVIAIVPALALGALLGGFIKEKFLIPWFVSISLIVGGLAILLIEKAAPEPTVHTIDEISPWLALKIGLCQCMAILVPGTSRSGATIMGALLFRTGRAAATEFSFFLAIPTMFAATLYDIYRSWKLLDTAGLTVIAVGFVAAFLTALLVVRFVVGFVSRHGFAPFAYYRIVVGIVMLAILAFPLARAG